MKNISRLRHEWLKSERKRRSGKGAKRRYLHFDNRLSLKDVRNLRVGVPNFVTRHSFFPFIRYTIKKRRLKKDKTTGILSAKIKKRDIDYSAHKDALIFSWYAYVLSDLYEYFLEKEDLGKNITAYRKGLGESSVDFAKRVFDFISQQSECAVICLDVTDFFSSLDHVILKRNWMVVLGQSPLPSDHFRLFEVITKFSYVLSDRVESALGLNKKKAKGRLCTPEEFRENVLPLIRVNKKTKGIPQGLSVSAILSNIYMIDFDKSVSGYISSLEGLYQRYCDDIIVVVPKKYAKKAEAFVLQEIKDIELEINPSKVEKRIFSEESDELYCVDSDSKKKVTLKYLGIEYDGRNTYIRHSGIGRYEKKMRMVVKKNQRLHDQGKRTAFSKKKIYQKFYSLRGNNFPSYVNKAAETLGSVTIKKQLSPYRIMKKIKGYRRK